MKLIYLSNARLPTERAHGYQIMKMCEAFSGLGIEVTLTHPFRVQPPRMTNAGDVFSYYGVRPIFRLKKLPSLDFRRLRFRRSQRLWFLIQAISNALANFLFSIRRWRDTDTIFYTRDKFIQSLLLLFRPLISGKLVFELHKQSRVIDNRIIGYLYTQLDLIAVLTRQQHRFLLRRRIPEGRILVAPDAVDLGKFDIVDTKQEYRARLHLPADRKIIGYLGRFQTMDQEKGIPALVEAMQYIQRRIPDNTPLLVCVGGPLDRVPYYLEIADKFAVRESNLRFIDRVPNADVPMWIKSFDVATLPFPHTSHYAYHMSPMKLFEYMASKVPIVASDLPSLKEVLTHEGNAWLVDSESPEALAEGIEKILLDERLSSRLAAQAFRDVKQYTWDLRAVKIIDKLAFSSVSA